MHPTSCARDTLLATLAAIATSGDQLLSHSVILLVSCSSSSSPLRFRVLVIPLAPATYPGKPTAPSSLARLQLQGRMQTGLERIERGGGCRLH